MSDAITIDLSVKAEKVLAQLDAMPERMAAAIAAAMNKQNDLTVSHIQRKYLSKRGPTTLGVRTNRLRSSINATAAHIDGDDVATAIGSNVVYAVAHEFGFSGDVQVRAHVRHGGMSDLFKAGGQVMTRREAIRRGLLIAKSDLASAGSNKKLAKDLQRRLGRQEKRKIAMAFGQVRAHKRHVVIPARAPIQHGILDRRTNYRRAISKAIVDSWKELGGEGTAEGAGE